MVTGEGWRRAEGPEKRGKDYKGHGPPYCALPGTWRAVGLRACLNGSRRTCEFLGPLGLYDTVGPSDEKLFPSSWCEGGLDHGEPGRRGRAEQPFFADPSCESSYEAPFGDPPVISLGHSKNVSEIIKQDISNI